MEELTIREQLEQFENTLADIEMYHMYEGKFDELVESFRNFEKLVEKYENIENKIQNKHINSKTDDEEITEIKFLGKTIFVKIKDRRIRSESIEK